MRTVCVLEGNLKERKGKLEEIKTALADHELFVFDKDDHYDYVSQMVTEISCFGELRLFIIKELPDIYVKSNKKGAELRSLKRTKVINSFKKLFPSIPAGNLVLFEDIGISSSSFLKEVEKHGTVYKYPQKISKKDAKKVIAEYFGEAKIAMSGDISEFVANSLNLSGFDVDIDKMDLLLIKLHNYVYGKSKVTKADVYAICSTSKEFIVWSLYNVLDEHDGENKYGRSFKIVMGFLLNSKYFRHEATMLLQSMLWRYGLLLLIKNGINNKKSMQEISDGISNIKKLKGKGRAQKKKMSSVEGKPEYSIKMINNTIDNRVASCYSFDELLLIYHVISKSLVKIRSGCTVSEITTFLQMVLLTICGYSRRVGTAMSGILEHKKTLREVA